MVISAQAECLERETGERSSETEADGPICPEALSKPREEDTEKLTNKELGRKGEEAAARYLEARGYEIVERNWECRFGEADIIAKDPEGTLCFIEVKTRRSIEAGLPEESVTLEKQRRYERIALSYMMKTEDWNDNDCIRFDAIGICATERHRALLRHHRGCFNGCF